MTRQQLEHLIRAASGICNEYEIMVIGSQSILGERPDAPEVLLKSMEADLYPLRAPEKAKDIENIGEESLFHTSYGYYAQPVSPLTAILPANWESRLVRIPGDGYCGYGLELHDLAASKIAAGREKDMAFVREMARHGMLNTDVLLDRLHSLPPDRLEGKSTDYLSKIARRIFRELSGLDPNNDPK